MAPKNNRQSKEQDDDLPTQLEISEIARRVEEANSKGMPYIPLLDFDEEDLRDARRIGERDRY